MRINVNYDVCEGHGMCEERAPEIFRLDDEGDLHYAFDDQDVPENLQSEAAAAASVCPVVALRLQR